MNRSYGYIFVVLPFNLFWICFTLVRMGKCLQAIQISEEEAMPGILGEDILLRCTLPQQFRTFSGFKLVTLWKRLKRDPSYLFYDRQSLQSDPRIQSYDDASGRGSVLSIQKLNMEDENDYECLINIDPNNYRKIFHLKLWTPPKISSEETTASFTKADIGKKITFQCQASGTPRPTVEWYYQQSAHTQKKKLVHQSDVNMNDGWLTLSNLQKSHSGFYTCLASNGVKPAAQHTIKLEIWYPTKVNVLYPRISQSVGESTLLRATVEGLPTPDIDWYFMLPSKQVIPLGTSETTCHPDMKQKYCIENKQTDMGTTSSVLWISNLTKEDYGIYVCVARNTLGSSNETVEVTRIQPPVNAGFPKSMKWNQQPKSPQQPSVQTSKPPIIPANSNTGQPAASAHVKKDVNQYRVEDTKNTAPTPRQTTIICFSLLQFVFHLAAQNLP